MDNVIRRESGRTPDSAWKRFVVLLWISWFVSLGLSRANNRSLQVTTILFGVVAALLWLWDLITRSDWKANKILRGIVALVVIALGAVYLSQAPTSPRTGFIGATGWFFGATGMYTVLGGAIVLLTDFPGLRKLTLHLGYLLLGVWWCIAVFDRTSNWLLCAVTVLFWLTVTVEMVMRSRSKGTDTLGRYPHLYKALAVISLSGAGAYIFWARTPNTWFFGCWALCSV